jgi:hypothetical protein
MIRRGLWFFLQLAVLVIVAVWLAEQPGAVSVEWRGWLLETSFGILVLLVIVLAALGALLWWVWRSIKGTPRSSARSPPLPPETPAPRSIMPAMPRRSASLLWPIWPPPRPPRWWGTSPEPVPNTFGYAIAPIPR